MYVLSSPLAYFFFFPPLDPCSEVQRDVWEWAFWRPAQPHGAVINVLSILIGFMCQGSPLAKWNYVSAPKSSCGAVSYRRYNFFFSTAENCAGIVLTGRKGIAEVMLAGLGCCAARTCKLWLRRSRVASEGGGLNFLFCTPATRTA